MLRYWKEDEEWEPAPMPELRYENPYLVEAWPWIITDPARDPYGTRFPMGRWLASFKLRERLCPKYSFAIPTDKAIRKIAKYGPVVEMGAGTGYWAWMLQQAGVDVIAYDARPTDNHWHGAVARSFTEVLPGRARDLAKHSDRTLFLCWPPMNDMALRCLQHYQGDTIIYIGENGGCTGNNAFHEKLDQEWDEISGLYIPMWPGVRDAMRIYRRIK